MSLEQKEVRNLVGFLPNESGGSIDGLEKIDDPLVEWTIFDGEKGETSAKENGEDDQRPLDDENEVAGEEEVGEAKANTKFEELLEGHVSHKAELILGDVLRDRVLLHDSSISGSDDVFVRGGVYTILGNPSLNFVDQFLRSEVGIFGGDFDC